MMSTVTLLAALLGGEAVAAVPDLYGMGPANIGMGSASTALADDPYAAYYNPAGLAQIRHIALNMAPILGGANLAPFEGIVYDANGDGQIQDVQGFPDYGPVGTDYRPLSGDKPGTFYTNGIQIGAVFPFWRRVALGIAAYMPSAALLQVDMADPYMPYYVMYKNMNNRFAVAPGLSIHPVEGVYLGLGVQVKSDISARGRLRTYADISAFSSDSDLDVDANVVAGVDNLTIGILPATALNFGVLLDLSALAASDDDALKRRLRRHAIGLAYRAPWYAGTSADVVATASGQIQFDDQTVLLSDLMSEPIHVELKDLIGFYTPSQLSIGLRTGFGDAWGGPGWTASETGRLTLVGDMTLTKWSKFVETTAPYQAIVVDDVEGVNVAITVGDDYGNPNFHDTVSWHGGARYTFGPYKGGRTFQTAKVHVRAGGAWVPTPVPAQTGRTNYMDSDRWMLAAGAGVEAAQLAPFKKMAPVARGPVRFDLGMQYHRLLTNTSVKDGSLLSDADGDGVVEYPRGYPLGGEITSRGGLWVVSFGIELQTGEAQKPPRPIRARGPSTPQDAIDAVREARDAEAPPPDPAPAPEPAPEGGDTEGGQP